MSASFIAMIPITLTGHPSRFTASDGYVRLHFPRHRARLTHRVGRVELCASGVRGKFPNP